MEKNRVLGVTGYMAGGKDTACGFLREYGVGEVDVDRLGHRVLEALLPEVEARFGRSFSTVDGTPDRRALGRFVYADPVRLRVLESILHPEMVRRVEVALSGLSGPLVVNAALLHKMGLDRLCDGVLLISAPDALLLKRAASRDGVSFEEARDRLAMQKKVNPIPKTADLQIENDRSPGDLRREVLGFSDSFFGEGPYGTAGTKWPQGDVHPQPGQ